jgi:hypothetical protein
VRRRVLLIAAVVYAVAVGAIVSMAWPRGTTPVTVDEALDDFRSQTTADPMPGTEPTVSGRPTPGVYTYASSGQEVVKLGVLPAETRPYHETTTIVIVDAGPSCFTATLNLLDQHTEDTTYCATPAGGLRLESHTKHQSIGAVKPTATMTCDPDLLASKANDPTTLACTLSLSGGPAQLTATVTAKTKATDTSVGVGDTEVDARLVDVTYAITGDLTGTWHEKTWFAATNWLPLRVERVLDLHGLATFTERSALELTDTAPRR